MKRELEDISCIKFTAGDLRKLFGPAKAILRNYALLPGMVFSALFHDGNPYIVTIQALLQRGTGELRMININSISQREYCRIAYEHLKSCISKLDNYDIILTINQPVFESVHNHIGLAVCAAILSAIKGVTFPSATIFFGGCDLFGTFYLDENNFVRLLQQTEDRFDMVFTALGAADHIHAWDSSSTSTFKIVQLANTKILFELIGNKNSNKTS